MSHHLKELTNAGLVKVRRETKFCFYKPERKVAENLGEIVLAGRSWAI